MSVLRFHADELEAQARAGRGASGAGIRSFMPDEHRSFFATLPYLFIATTDAGGWPLATMLTAEPGFVRSPDPVTLRVDSLPAPEDPLAATLNDGKEFGVLGIDFSTRRRNRANGQISSLDATGLSLAVHQSFGNCAKYIQRRIVQHAPRTQRTVELINHLDVEARTLIGRADTLFVASRSRSEIRSGGGIDISHRGGRPGFVDVLDDCLVIPDFPGNRYYNTLGNLLGEPRASLLFIDFQTGDLLQLQGIATIDWKAEGPRQFEGAERLWCFEVTRGWRRRGASPLRWSFVDYSPVTLRTGSWVQPQSRALSLGEASVSGDAAAPLRGMQ
jgi:uncharacterized protein